MLRWYWYSQNNSGGYDHVDQNLAGNLFIQADSEESAMSKYKNLTESSNEDSCGCCGERWGSYLEGVGVDPFEGYEFKKGSRYHWENGDITETHPRTCKREYNEEGYLVDSEALTP